MTDIVERLRSENTLTGYYDPPQLQEEAAAEIERLRAALLVAEMEAELDDLEDVGRLLAIGRREGVEAAIEAAMRVPIPDDASVAEAHGRLAAAQDICARIDALLYPEKQDD